MAGAGTGIGQLVVVLGQLVLAEEWMYAWVELAMVQALLEMEEAVKQLLEELGLTKQILREQRWVVYHWATCSSSHRQTSRRMTSLSVRSAPSLPFPCGLAPPS